MEGGGGGGGSRADFFAERSRSVFVEGVHTEETAPSTFIDPSRVEGGKSVWVLPDEGF